MIYRKNSITVKSCSLCWDEENRLTTVRDAGGEPPMYLSSYIYNAAGERVWKLAGEDQLMWISGDLVVNAVYFFNTLYSSPYMVMNEKEYTKHYYIEGERVCSKIGGGYGNAPNDIYEPVPYLAVDPDQQSEDLWNMVIRGAECIEYNPEYVYIDDILESAQNDGTDYENLRYFYHTDHLGSSSFISDAGGDAVQHLQYLPFGETFIDERTDAQYNTPYKFSGKEKDDETQYSYFGARYYDSDLSVWLSVDPMASFSPDLTPYHYCQNKPIVRIDPDGAWDDEWEVLRKKDGSLKISRLSGLGGDETQIIKYASEGANGEHIQSRNPVAYNGTRQEFASSIANSPQWNRNSSNDKPYDGSAAANALCDGWAKALFGFASIGASLPILELSFTAKSISGFVADFGSQMAFNGGNIKDWNISGSISAAVFKNPFTQSGVGSAFDMRISDITSGNYFNSSILGQKTATRCLLETGVGGTFNYFGGQVVNDMGVTSLFPKTLTSTPFLFLGNTQSNGIIKAIENK